MPKTVKLSKPIEIPGQPAITHIKLQDPTFRDFLEIGMPATWVSVKDGGFEQVTESVVGEWVERLYEGDENLLLTLSLRDTFKLREAVLSFFREAMAPDALLTGSEPSPEPSSSSSTSTPQPSTI